MDNNLIELISKDPMFKLNKEELEKSLDSTNYIGRSSNQVREFIEEFIKPILEEYKEVLGEKAEINV